jgi:hypothetical protein
MPEAEAIPHRLIAIAPFCAGQLTSHRVMSHGAPPASWKNSSRCEGAIMRLNNPVLLGFIASGAAFLFAACSSSTSGSDAAVQPDASNSNNPDAASNTGVDAGADAGPPCDAGSCFPCPGYAGNSVGVGAYCSSSVSCPNTNVVCGASFGYDLCVLPSCTSSAACGASACCASVSFMGTSYSVCLPEGCGQCPDGGTATVDAGAPDSGSGTGDAGSTCTDTLGTCSPCPGYLGNDAGLGAYCSKGGNQCKPFGLLCPLDLGENYNFCVTNVLAFQSCNVDSGVACGAGECCASQQGVDVCLPTGCQACP